MKREKERNKKEKKVNIKLTTKGLSDEEKRYLRYVVQKINIKRRRANMPRLRYKIKLE